MQIVILAAIILVLSLKGVPTLALSPGALIAAAGGYLLLAAAFGAASTRFSLRWLDDARYSGRKRVLLAMAGQVYLVAGLATLILLGFGDWVSALPHMNRIPLLGYLITFGPFILALLITWLLDYPFYRRMRTDQASGYGWSGLEPMPVWTRREFLDYNLRHNLLFIAVPVGLILLLRDALQMYIWPPLCDWLVRAFLMMGYGFTQEQQDMTLNACLAMIGLGVFLVAPVLIVRVWRTESLDAGPLRSELEATLGQFKLRCRDILLWRSGGAIANAGVMGLVAPFRYVLMTDALMANLDKRHLHAIFAHEMGHIKCHHILYSAVFSVATIMLAGACVGVLMARINLPDWIANLIAISILAAIWWLSFGRLSRQFERQSDVIGAWSVGAEFNASGDPQRITAEGAAIFAQALQRVAQLNGVSSNAPNWRHGTIAQRIEYILWLGATGQTRRIVDRRVVGIKRAIWVLLIVSIAATAAATYWGAPGL